MKKLASKITAVLVAAGLMFSAGTIGNIDFGLTAFAEENTAEGYTNGFCDKYELKADGSWGLIDDDANCTHTNCNGYQPATKNTQDCYEIGNAGQLYWFADKVNNDKEHYGSAKAVLTANITVNSGLEGKNGLLDSLEYNETGEVTNGENITSWTPIGNSNNQYTGTFDGQGHTISGLYFINTSTEYVGLFGMVESGGSVSNVGVEDSYFKGKDYVGGVCGLNYCGTITNCYNTGNVSGSGRVGGVCGKNAAAADAHVTTITNVTATITNCYNTGAVSGTNDYVAILKVDTR